MRQTLQIGSIQAAPGSIATGHLPVAELSDSTPVGLPVIIVNGAEDGPVLLITAAIHGPELTGSEVIRRICRELIDPAKLRGAIVALPIANPFAFRACSWLTPEDGFNLNRSFPGGTEKWLTPRIAHVIYEQVVKQSNAILDYHCMCDPTMMYTNVKRTPNVEVSKRSRAMADSFGLSAVELVVEQNMAHRSGTMLEAAHAIGIPGLSVELDVWRRIPEQAVQIGVRGALNVMKDLKMIDGTVEPQEGVPVLDGVLGWVEVFANRGGLVEICKRPYEWVDKGEVACRIRNPFGDVLEEVRSPIDGYVIGYPMFWNQAVGTGEMLLFLASVPQKG